MANDEAAAAIQAALQEIDPKVLARAVEYLLKANIIQKRPGLPTPAEAEDAPPAFEPASYEISDRYAPRPPTLTPIAVLPGPAPADLWPLTIKRHGTGLPASSIGRRTPSTCNCHAWRPPWSPFTQTPRKTTWSWT